MSTVFPQNGAPMFQTAELNTSLKVSLTLMLAAMNVADKDIFPAATVLNIGLYMPTCVETNLLLDDVSFHWAIQVKTFLSLSFLGEIFCKLHHRLISSFCSFKSWSKISGSCRLWHQKWVKFLILNMTFIMLCPTLVPWRPFWHQSQQHPWRVVYLNPISLYGWKRNKRQESAQLPNNTANGLLPSLAVQTNQTNSESERSLWNKDRSLRRWRKWQPIRKTGVLEYSCNIGVLQIFLLGCLWESLWPWRSLQWQEAVPPFYAPGKNKRDIKPVWCASISAHQSPAKAYPGFSVPWPSSGASGKRGGGECAAPAQAPMPHW